MVDAPTPNEAKSLSTELVALAPYALLIACLAAQIMGVPESAVGPIKLVAALVIDPRQLPGARK